MEKLEDMLLVDDMLLACSVRCHGLENWKMVAAKFSNAILNRRGCILNLSPAECQIKYENLKERFKILYQTNFNEEEDDETEFVKLIADKLTKAYIADWREKEKLINASLEKPSHRLYKLEAEERIKLSVEEDDDKSKDKIINQDYFLKVLEQLRSHQHCCLFESRLSTQESSFLNYNRQVKQHMDLQIIQNKLEQNVYSNMEIASFFRDLLLMFNNAIIHYPKETLQHSTAIELRAIVVRELGKKPLFRHAVVCGLAAAGNPMLAKQRSEKRAYNNTRKKAEEGGESSVRRSTRVKSKARK